MDLAMVQSRDVQTTAQIILPHKLLHQCAQIRVVTVSLHKLLGIPHVALLNQTTLQEEAKVVGAGVKFQFWVAMVSLLSRLSPLIRLIAIKIVVLCSDVITCQSYY